MWPITLRSSQVRYAIAVSNTNMTMTILITDSATRNSMLEDVAIGSFSFVHGVKRPTESADRTGGEKRVARRKHQVFALQRGRRPFGARRHGAAHQQAGQCDGVSGDVRDDFPQHVFRSAVAPGAAELACERQDNLKI